jgi:glycosyltransferase involved in cell wall biosynthesis
MKTPHISVVVPAHNAQRTLRSCLDSIFAQRLDGLSQEVLVVVDSSTDRTLQIAESFPVQVLVIDARNKSKARNRGAGFAAGELVVFVDADCILHPSCLQKMGGHLFRMPFVSAAPIRFVGQRKFSFRAVPVISTGACIYRRAVFEFLRGFDEQLLDCEDTDLTFALLAAGHLIYLEDRELASTSGVQSRRRNKEKKAGLSRLKKKWPGLGGLPARDFFRGRLVSPPVSPSGFTTERSQSHQPIYGGVLDGRSVRLIGMEDLTQYEFVGIERDFFWQMLKGRASPLEDLAGKYGVPVPVLKRDVRAFAAHINQIGSIPWGNFAQWI